MLYKNIHQYKTSKFLLITILTFLLLALKFDGVHGVCGDCIPDFTDGEECDDCNTAKNDGCNNLCEIETGYMCFVKVDGSICKERCGDGLNINNEHECDDGNNLSKDGCSSTCTVETGFTCTAGTSTAKSVCTEACDGTWRGFLPCDGGACCTSCTTVNTGCTCIRGGGCNEGCGSGVNYGLDPSKECDDGIANAGHEYYGDGCDWKCKVETGYTCPLTGKCTETCGATTNDYYNYPCDDGNNINGDGCSSTCQIETGYYCYNGNPLFRQDECYEICGDGLDYGLLWCDDGNEESGDGCDSTCHIERGYSCTGGTLTKADKCTEICGDGIDHHYYECEDGNLVNGDGCSSTCKVETGYRCFAGNFDVADKCIEICGDSIRINNTVGLCDDGNVVSGDGCSKICDIETGWTCSGGSPTSRDACVETCGDGLSVGGLECDDGNILNGDGCSSTCTVELGFYCEGGSAFAADTCKEICGDGLNMKKYQCDDNNIIDGDGCDSSCMIEKGWYCFGGDSTTRDICKLLPQPKVDNITISADNKLVTIYFNETIMLSTKWNSTMFNSYVIGPKSPYSLYWTLLNAEFHMQQATQVFQLELDITDQLYENVNQILAVDFKDVSFYRSFTTTRPVRGMQPILDQNCTVYSLHSIHNLLHNMLCVYETVAIPTHIYDDEFSNDTNHSCYEVAVAKLCSSSGYPTINKYYTSHDLLTTVYLYNIMDILFFAAFFIALIPGFMLLKKLFSKVDFMQSAAKRYYTSVIQEVILLAYMKLSLIGMLNYFNFKVYDDFTGWSDVANLLFTIFVIGGLPLIHVILLIKRACLNYGVDKKFKPKKDKKKDVLQQAQDKVDDDGNADPEKAKKEKKQGEMEGKNDMMTESDESDDDFTADEQTQLIDAQKKINEYRFKQSFLYQMAWGDLNDHYTHKLLFYMGICAKRVAYAFALVYYKDDGCIAAQYFMMVNVAAMSWTIGLQPFKYNYLLKCAIADELFTTIASITLFAYYQKNSPKETVQGFAYILFGCIALMMISSVYFMIKEVLRRTKPDFADVDGLGGPPKLPEFNHPHHGKFKDKNGNPITEEEFKKQEKEEQEKKKKMEDLKKRRESVLPPKKDKNDKKPEKTDPDDDDSQLDDSDLVSQDLSVTDDDDYDSRDDSNDSGTPGDSRTDGKGNDSDDEEKVIDGMDVQQDPNDKSDNSDDMVPQYSQNVMNNRGETFASNFGDFQEFTGNRIKATRFD
eukprot:403363576